MLRARKGLRLSGYGQAIGGEVTDKSAAVAQSAADFQVGVVPAQGVFHDRKAEPGATTLSRPSAVGTVEALGDPRDVFLGNSYAGVLDSQCPPSASTVHSIVISPSAACNARHLPPGWKPRIATHSPASRFTGLSSCTPIDVGCSGRAGLPCGRRHDCRHIHDPVLRHRLAGLQP